FGLAKLLDTDDSSPEGTTLTARPITQQGTVLGTVAYMSPEQAEGRKVDARSDIFSFGSVLYEMVTGRKPFAGDSRLSLLNKIVSEDPTPPGQLAARFRRIWKRSFCTACGRIRRAVISTWRM